jgi:hypothetical protein
MADYTPYPRGPIQDVTRHIFGLSPVSRAASADTPLAATAPSCSLGASGIASVRRQKLDRPIQNGELLSRRQPLCIRQPLHDLSQLLLSLSRIPSEIIGRTGQICSKFDNACFCSRADELLDQGDVDGARVWQRIANAIDYLEAKGTGGRREGALTTA